MTNDLYGVLVGFALDHWDTALRISSIYRFTFQSKHDFSSP